MQKILMSACLLGNKLRYDGQHNLIHHQIIENWLNDKRVLALCPEVTSGMSVPRLPCEIVNEAPLQVMDIKGNDQTHLFIKGAKIALALVHKHKIKVAILKQSSPSCGSRFRYDGQFAKQKIPGEGVTARLLRQHNVTIFDENQIEQAEKFLLTLGR